MILLQFISYQPIFIIFLYFERHFYKSYRQTFIMRLFAGKIPGIKRRSLLVAGTLFVVHSALLAQAKQVTLTGYIDVNSGESFQYKIVLTESEGKIKGYSLTYKEPDETKAEIQGELDRRNHRFSFKEKDIIYSHGFHTKAYMCLIDATLGYVQSAKGLVLKGSITSAEADNTVCTGGTITFSNQDEIQNLFGYHEQYDTVITMKKKGTEESNKPASSATDGTKINDGNGMSNEQRVVAQPMVGTDKITTGIEKTYDWYSDSAVIDVYDGGIVDGDRITLLFNDKPYLTNYYLVKEKRQLRIPLDHIPINTITIIANTEGSDPPNTASILLSDGPRTYSVLAYNLKGQRSVIKLRRAK